jgi:hypothetical protein
MVPNQQEDFKMINSKKNEKKLDQRFQAQEISKLSAQYAYYLPNINQHRKPGPTSGRLFTPKTPTIID